MPTKYFRNFGLVDYSFGDGEAPVLFQNLTQYVDVIDQIKDQTSFYNKHTIAAGDRPDTLSYQLYGTTEYYWTFFLMNDHLRESGWPLPGNELLDYAKTLWPHRTVTSEDDFARTFPVGTRVSGQRSGTVGTVLFRRLDLGQAVIETDGGEAFDSSEIIEYSEPDGTHRNMKLVGEVEQHNAIHHFEDENGEHVDIDPHDDAFPSGKTRVTNLDRLEKKNEELKEIIVLKTDSINGVVSEFNKFMKG